MQRSRDSSYDKFSSHVAKLIGAVAESKGYDDDLFDFVSSKVTAHHGLAEIIYKVVRYKEKGDMDDLVKIAAWAFLEWQGSPSRGFADPTPTVDGVPTPTTDGARKLQ